MLMVIFGAGASYDSDPSNLPQPNSSGRSYWRPPLAQELFGKRFDEVATDYGPAQALFPHLRRSTSVEATLNDMVSEVASYPERQIHLLALRYYIRDAVKMAERNWFTQSHRGVTNYLELVDKLRRWQYGTEEAIGFVTFNYDRMLEDATQRALVSSFLTVESCVSRQDVRIFKVHGSTHWLRYVRSFDVEAVPGDPTPLSSLLHAWKGHPTPLLEAADSHDMIPAIAVPTQTKSEFECPPEHITLLDSLLPSVTKVIVIGWQAREEHFMSRWQTIAGASTPRHTRKLLVVDRSRDDAAPIASRIRETVGIAESDVTLNEGGFSHLMSSQPGRETLARFLGDR